MTKALLCLAVLSVDNTSAGSGIEADIPRTLLALLLNATQVQLRRAGLSSPLVPSPSPGDETRTAPLVRGLMLQVGETLSVWSRMAAAGPGVTKNVYPPGMFSKVSLTSGEEAFASMSAHVGLLRALLAKEGWSPPLADCLREVRQFSPSSFSLPLHTAGFVADCLWLCHASIRVELAVCSCLAGVFEPTTDDKGPGGSRCVWD